MTNITEFHLQIGAGLIRVIPLCPQMYKVKRSWSWADQCGTANSRSIVHDMNLSILTDCCLLEGIIGNNVTPILLDGVVSNDSWSMVSNATNTTKNTKLTDPLESLP